MHTDKIPSVKIRVIRGNPARIFCASLCLFVAITVSGCVTRPPLNNADRLMAEPGFVDAAKAAPKWTSDALKTINRLEAEIENPRR